VWILQHAKPDDHVFLTHIYQLQRTATSPYLRAL
jgi:hypothetical protein